MDVIEGIIKRTSTLADQTDSCIILTVNGKQYEVIHANPNMYLNEFLRCYLHLTGTKRLCAEGGCGSCVVAVSKYDPSVHPESIQAINSCMAPILSLDGYYIITIEGLGSKKGGFHEIQNRFASNFASQCGFCTPGFIMNGFSLLASDSGGKTKKEIEDAFDGNLCRCTGYRPILDAMKSFAKECHPVDIEDFRSIKSCKQMCGRSCHKESINFPRSLGPTSSWMKPSSVLEALATIARFKGSPVRFVAGNTAVGVYKNDGSFDLYIDLKNLAELNKIQVTGKFVEFGASVTLTSMVKFFEQKSMLCSSFQILADHIKKVANVPVRNVATWAGNLMMRHAHPNFPSDIYIILETVGAKLNIIDVNGNVGTLEMREFLLCDMNQKVILSMTLPFSLPGEVIRTFKIMPRKQNSYAYVHAGFKANIDQETLIIRGKPTICFGGMGLKSVRITEAEQLLESGNLNSYSTFEDAVKIILRHLEANPENKIVDFNYCKNVAVNLFYKFCVLLRGTKICGSISSAGCEFNRPVSSGKQSFHINNQAAPLNQPTERIEGKLQASGEVLFTLDLPPHPREAYASFVLSDQGNAKLAGLDVNEAMKCPGFIGIFSEKDIPGINAFMHGKKQGEIFASDRIEFAGQVVAIVVADSQRNADNIAKKVRVNYSHVRKPITTIEEAIEEKSFHPKSKDFSIGNTEMAFEECDHIISGTIRSGSQHHIYLEAQNCYIVKEEHDYKVFSSTQCTRDVQAAVAKVLGINAARVTVEVNRVGGAFGGKFQYPPMIAGAVAVAVHHLDRPIRTLMTLDANLKAIGKRPPILNNYKVGFSKEGYLKAIHVDVFCDSGCYPNCADGERTMEYMDNAYFCPNWKITVTECKTNTPFNTFFRGPGNIQSVIVMEEVIDQMATFLGDKTPEQIKEINLYKSGQYNFTGYKLQNCLLQHIWQEIQIKADYEERRAEVVKFNEKNRWRKRGMSIMPLKYVHRYMGLNFSVLASIYYADGSVAISHGGIEMGQGIHTRVRNVAASKLGIPVDLVSVKPTTTVASPNSIETGGSVTSEMNCVAAYKCCEILLERIEPIRKKFPHATWKELIRECERSKIELVATCMFTKNDPYIYSTYGATCSTVEIDVLTGEMDVLRSDIMYDCGESINQGIDIGQVEGAFVQGMGYFLTEKVVYDPESGVQLTTNTWEYKPPMSKDIPIDMRVYLLHDVVNPLGFIRSKAVGEPALCMAASCLFAVKDAIKAARNESCDNPENFCLNAPATIDKIQTLCQVNTEHLTFSNEITPFR